ncbi:calcium-transporting ATPase 8 plasma membrane-type [Phtheirospermum japonicum]|uniref:Calcium-transporting ATPase 8 plasma membrane-type n=1 Tax=Phtheirospermum japonicum TaxID=374723 RepID=A0A830DII5_9LAMI|nr:calcium-transporting ATPase 8 plasma membrane-type [Phtheirospermum japonicum]
MSSRAAIGYFFSFSKVTDIGQVWGWGYGGEGQLGLGSRIIMVSSPHPIACIDSSFNKDRLMGLSRGTTGSEGQGFRVPGSYVKAISCGGRHSAVITDAGALLTFGLGLYGHVVRWGRSVYANIQKFIQFQLIVNVAALVINVVAAVSAGNVPLYAVQMCNLSFPDGWALFALCFDLYQVIVLLTLNFLGRRILGLEHESSDHAFQVKNTLIFNAFVLYQSYHLYFVAPGRHIPFSGEVHFYCSSSLGIMACLCRYWFYQTGQAELIALEKVLKAAMTPAGTARENMRDSLSKKNRPKPTAIFVVNFDKVRIDPWKKEIDLDSLIIRRSKGQPPPPPPPLTRSQFLPNSITLPFCDTLPQYLTFHLRNSAVSAITAVHMGDASQISVDAVLATLLEHSIIGGTEVIDVLATTRVLICGDDGVAATHALTGEIINLYMESVVDDIFAIKTGLSFSTKTKKQNKPVCLLDKSHMKKEFHRMAKAVSNQVGDNYYRRDLKKASLARLSVLNRSLKVAKSGIKKKNRQPTY